MSGAPSVEGRSFCLTGTNSVNRSVAFQMIEDFGGEAVNSVRWGTDYLVIGTKPGATKLAAAKRNKTKVMNEAQFWSLFPPKYRPKDAVVALGFEVTMAIVKGKEEPVKTKKTKKYKPPKVKSVDVDLKKPGEQDAPVRLIDI